jgi:hypothetical protein
MIELLNEFCVRFRLGALWPLCLALACPVSWAAQGDTAKPVLHGKHWVAVTGKPWVQQLVR